MAPNIDCQAAVEDERVAEFHDDARSMMPTIIKSERHQADDQCAIAINIDKKCHDVGCTEVEATKVTRICETPNNNFTRHPMVSFFMGKCDDYNGTIERSITRSALMASFDVQEEEIDFIASTSTPNIEQLQELQRSTAAANAVAIFSTDEELARQLQTEEDDEELARQLQAEEDESARTRHEIIFRKSQKASRTTTITTTTTSSSSSSYATPTRKSITSWLDNLIGEPFPSEVRRNYSRSDSTDDHDHVLPRSSHHDSCCKRLLLPGNVVDAPLAQFSSLLLNDSCRYSHECHETHKTTQIPLWCLTAF